MRLTCPRCGAQYEIPDSAIPATGREVECSACSEVWHQPGAGPLPAAGETAQVSQPEENYDPADRPALHRPLHESILSILREETARELSARKGVAAEDAEGGDQVGSVPAVDEAPAPVDIRWPVATVILPGEPLKPGEGDEAAGDQPNHAEPTPPEPPAEPRLPDAARLAATLLRQPQSETLDAEEDPGIEEEDEANRPVITAGMLQRPDREEVAPPAPPPVAQIPPAAPPARQAAPAPRKSRAGYAAGFGLAVLLAAALVAFYAMTSPAAEGEAGSTVSDWRSGLDHGRLWLSDRAGAIWTRIAGE